MHSAQVLGLEGVQYTDSVSKSTACPGEPSVNFTGEVDRVYPNAPSLTLTIPGTMVISRSASLPDVVVWNPWIDKARGMADFADEEYVEMVCVEVGRVARPLELQPGQSAAFSQTLTVW